MKTMRRVKSGLMAMVLGVSMMTAAPVDVKAETPPHALVTPCDCGATMIYQGDIEISCVSSGDETHTLVADHYYHCRYGHVRSIRTTTEESHTWSHSDYDDVGHHTAPGELFGDHSYRIKCTKCGGSRVVTIICNYPGSGSHNKPF